MIGRRNDECMLSCCALYIALLASQDYTIEPYTRENCAEYALLYPFVSSPRESCERSTYGRYSDLSLTVAPSRLRNGILQRDWSWDLQQRVCPGFTPDSLLAFALGCPIQRPLRTKRTVVGMLIFSKNRAKVLLFFEMCKFLGKK